jgi:hypothetical protein
VGSATMRRASRGRRALRCAPAAALAAAAWSLAMAAGAAAQSPVPAAPTVIDGPSSAIVGLSGMSIARDGTGGVVYLKRAGGAVHVFVSRLAGRFQSPEQVDAGLAGPSSQPVIAAGNGGLLVVAFVNGGTLYAVTRPATGSAYSAPRALAGGASNPAIAVTTLGKVYLAFTASGSGGHDVRCAYYYNGGWGIEAAALDAAAGDDAGAGAGRPAVAASNDGIGIVVWGEAGHVFSRRVWGTSPSIVYEQADVASLGGWNEVSADQPVIGTGGDSSYAAVAFHEVFASGAQTQSRVLSRRLHGSLYEGVAQPDGLSTPGPEGAAQPQVSVGEYGQGFVTSGRDTSRQVVAMTLGSQELPGPVQRIDGLQNTAAPLAVPTAAGYHSSLVAWQEDPLLGNPEIRARYFDGTSFGSETVLSSPSLGPTDAASGLFADADIAADVAVTWVQISGGAPAIVVAQMYQAPGSFGPAARFQYVRTANPTLSWSPSGERWGPVRYAVTLDRAQIAQTTATSAAVPAALFPSGLGQGRHTWSVTATNPAGLSRTMRGATVFVDTIAPVAHVRLAGKRTLGSVIRLILRYTDAPSGTPRSDTSGIKEVRVKWGDRKGARYGRPAGKSHVYAKPGTYPITVILTDRAGNRTQVKKRVRIMKPVKKHKA